jgi:hypothetical protein
VFPQGWVTTLPFGILQAPTSEVGAFFVPWPFAAQLRSAVSNQPVPMVGAEVIAVVLLAVFCAATQCRPTPFSRS